MLGTCTGYERDMNGICTGYVWDMSGQHIPLVTPYASAFQAIQVSK